MTAQIYIDFIFKANVGPWFQSSGRRWFQQNNDLSYLAKKTKEYLNKMSFKDTHLMIK